jgi:hypothetical protein
LLEIAALLWTAVALSLPGQYWRDSYSGPRAFTPLMIFVFLSGLRFSPRLAAAPLLMTVPRVAAQVLAPLLMGLRILR